MNHLVMTWISSTDSTTIDCDESAAGNAMITASITSVPRGGDAQQVGERKSWK